MAGNVVLGPYAKVDVGPSLVPFRVVTGHISDAADVNETTDSETLWASKEHHPGGYQAAGIELEIQLDTDSPNPTSQLFINTIGLTPGNRIPITIWPEGRGVSNSNWVFPNVIVRSFTPGFMIRGTQPQGGSLSLISTGYYKRPFETAQSVASSVSTRY